MILWSHLWTHQQPSAACVITPTCPHDMWATIQMKTGVLFLYPLFVEQIQYKPTVQLFSVVVESEIAEPDFIELLRLHKSQLLSSWAGLRVGRTLCDATVKEPEEMYPSLH